MPPTLEANHVTIDANGVARIDGTRFKVLHLAMAVRGGTVTPEQLHDAYPQLSLAQICSALACYYDNQAAFDRQIDDELVLAISERNNAPISPLRAKLGARR